MYKKKITIKTIYIILLCLIPIYSIGFIVLGEPSLKGDIPIQTYSDSLTYEAIAKNLSSEVNLVSVSGNFIGPVYLIKVVNFNYIAIFLINITALILSIYLINKFYCCNLYVFSFFIFLNPLIFFSLFNVNKEIFIILDIALFVVFMKNKNFFILFLVLALSFFIRWQMSLFFICLLIMIYFSDIGFNRLLLLVLLLLGLSLTYPLISGAFEKVTSHALSDSDLGGSGIFTKLNEIQKYYGGYFFSFLPKFLQLNLGIIARSSQIGDIKNFWNYTVLLLHSWMTFILFIKLIYNKSFSISNDLIFSVVIFAMIFSLTPISNIRYFLPMYLLLAISVSIKKNSNY